MNYDIITSENFIRELKRLAKKYLSLKNDLSLLGEKLALDPTQGTPIGKDCYKIRLAIKSKGKGKSAGARAVRRCGSNSRFFDSRKSDFTFNLRQSG